MRVICFNQINLIYVNQGWKTRKQRKSNQIKTKHNLTKEKKLNKLVLYTTKVNKRKEIK